MIKVIIVLLIFLYLLLSFKKFEINSFKFDISHIDTLQKPFSGHRAVNEFNIRNTRLPKTLPPNLDLKQEIEIILSKSDSKSTYVI